ncbi:MAG: 50S ribosomal protein L21 [Patescibacteria group bacterium]|nr:50S ribosomal protein L21 [Patescibacteria group bacterium]MDD5715350.1 50S ribosomal protein L21 [Patescibacteria group bacterium]
MKFAIISQGGKQYRVHEGKSIRFETIAGTVGSTVTFKDVLMYSDGAKTIVGKPTVPKVRVTGKIEEHGKADKVMVVKYKAKTRYHITRGHRQHFTRVKIASVGIAA